SQAYLFQSKPVQVYGVNLVTGQSTLLQGDTGTTANVNGVGFDFDSRYIYGYDTTNKKIVRLGKDFKVEDIYTSGLPTAYTFYVGD
ncbi:LruC domain-containing protein, partial [Vibrio campbellii]